MKMPPAFSFCMLVALGIVTVFMPKVEAKHFLILTNLLLGSHKRRR